MELKQTLNSAHRSTAYICNKIIIINMRNLLPLFILLLCACKEEVVQQKNNSTYRIQWRYYTLNELDRLSLLTEVEMKKELELEGYKCFGDDTFMLCIPLNSKLTKDSFDKIPFGAYPSLGFPIFTKTGGKGNIEYTFPDSMLVEYKVAILSRYPHLQSKDDVFYLEYLKKNLITTNYRNGGYPFYSIMSDYKYSKISVDNKAKN